MGINILPANNVAKDILRPGTGIRIKPHTYVNIAEITVKKESVIYTPYKNGKESNTILTKRSTMNTIASVNNAPINILIGDGNQPNNIVYNPDILSPKDDINYCNYTC